ncbi:unnamed protein product [Urochloa decumbens]|uniref:Peptidase A1 domain-containing protein n=1 Tax=Urochloa decumbens TaxID=240449 RepID=A0ABC9DUP4_9POAL
MFKSKVAMAVVWPLLVLLLSGSSRTVRAADDEHEYTVVEMRSLQLMNATCYGHKVTSPHNRTWLPLNLLHGPCSASSNDATPSLDDLFLQDQQRIGDIHWRLSDDGVGGNQGNRRPPGKISQTNVQNVPAAPFHVGNQQNTASSSKQGSQLSIDPAATGGGGQSSLPGVVQMLLLDTASDVPWVQCVPCPIPPCHPQTDVFYDPTRSSTYAPFSCNSPACTQLGPYANGCVNNQCQYRVTYPDGSSSSGTYISDLLTINPTNAISNFQFGCSHVEQGRFDNQTAGIMALGGGSESLVSQTALTYGNAFAYCIPPTPSYKGYFLLGVPSVAASRYMVTPILRNPQVPTFYRVLLRDITVAGERLNVPASVFAPGSVLDTRTVFTRLPPTAYQALRAAFRSSMTMYRSAPPKGAFDTCYDLTGVGTVRLPKIALVFDRNAVVEIDPSGILYDGCLAFVPNRNDNMPGVLGNLQQRTIEVFYNVGGGAVGFRRGVC